MMLRNLWIVLCFYVAAVDGFSSRSAFRIGRRHQSTSAPVAPEMSMSNFDNDFSEMLAPEFKYELVPLPDSMLDTTLFVGNLDEFVYDKDLSDLFQSVSVLHSLPACVVRKPNFETLRYGFVTFPSVEEKENAILRYHGSIWKGKCIKVEPILDHPKAGRVRVPEQLVSYVSGSLKKTRDGRVNSLRRARNDDKAAANSKGKKKQKAKMARPSNQQGSGHHAGKLSWKDQAELERSARKGYVTLDKRDNGNKRVSTSSLVGMHRTRCDTRAKPQIVYCKAAGSGQLDHVMIDLSTLRKTGIFDKVDLVEQCLLQYKLDILEAASSTGMELRRNEECGVKTEEEEEACDTMEDVRSGDTITEYGITEEDLTRTNWSSKPKISRLPVVTLGVFVGERANSKAMARALAQLWQLPEELEMMDSGLFGGEASDRTSSSKSRRGGAWVSDSRSKYKNERRRGGGGRHRR